jgi:hypothetical protein
LHGLAYGKRLVFSILGKSDPLKDKDGEATLGRVGMTLCDWYVRRRQARIENENRYGFWQLVTW